jgi:hypothetical protein
LRITIEFKATPHGELSFDLLPLAKQNVKILRIFYQSLLILLTIFNLKIENQEPENQEPENQEPENQEPENQEPENHEPESHEPKNHELKNVKVKNVLRCRVWASVLY